MVPNVNTGPWITIRCKWKNFSPRLVKSLWSPQIQGSWINATFAIPTMSCWLKIAIAALLLCKLIWTIFMVLSVMHLIQGRGVFWFLVYFLPALSFYLEEGLLQSPLPSFSFSADWAPSKGAPGFTGAGLKAWSMSPTIPIALLYSVILIFGWTW